MLATLFAHDACGSWLYGTDARAKMGAEVRRWRLHRRTWHTSASHARGAWGDSPGYPA